MRILPTDEHQSRKEKILQAVVHLYIKSGKPVGSSSIIDEFKIGLSPATIRNVMAELEKDGYLTHPHTSAGRMPTDKGYRSYVNSIVHVQQLAAEEEARIRSEYTRRMQEIENLMQSTSKVLSVLSQCTGFVLPAPMTEEKLRRVELIPVSHTQILAVMISESGSVQNHMIEVSGLPQEDSLREASRFLNQRLSGLSFSEAQASIGSELFRYQEQMRLQRDFVSQLAEALFDMSSRPDMFVEGTSNILKFPEFQDYETMHSFARLVDEKTVLSQALAKEIRHQKGVRVRIGDENAPELKNFSVISTQYELNGRPMGVIGILGPKRMEYQRMMSIVGAVANLVNHMLEENAAKLLEGKDFYE